ncbi:MAG: SDR family oxidoreductase [Bacteroidetes bacterium]|nr:SDR family oxidoreductase [Bacteroidota bacterium]
MDFSNKAVLITGGSRGIGRAIAIAFAEKGAKVAVNFKSDKEAASETVEMLAGEGHFAIKANISAPDAARQLVKAVVNEFGQLDIVVNNAGIFELHPMDDTVFDDWQASWKRTLDVNLIGAADICYWAAQHFIKNKSGKIINVSSRGAFRGEPLAPAYAASKAALNAMSQSLSKALAKYNIFVGVVAPGFVATDMVKELLEGPEGDSIREQSPFNRVAEPEEVAHAILFLASEGAEFTSGTIIDINGASYLRS